MNYAYVLKARLWLALISIGIGGCWERPCEEMDPSDCEAATGCKVAYGYPYDANSPTCFGSKKAIGCFDSEMICTFAITQGTAPDGACYQVSDGCNARGGQLTYVDHCAPDPALCQTTSIPQCSQLSESECDLSPFCDAVSARPYDAQGECYEEARYIGCRPTSPCDAALAYAEDVTGTCHEFSQTECYPQGQTWVATEACGRENTCD